MRVTAALGAEVLAAAALAGAASAATPPRSDRAVPPPQARVRPSRGGSVAGPLAVVSRGGLVAGPLAVVSRGGLVAGPLAVVSRGGLVAGPLAVVSRGGSVAGPVAVATRCALAELPTRGVPLASATPATHPMRPQHHSRGRHRRLASRRLRLRSVMLNPDVLVGQDVAFVGVTRPGPARRLIGVQRRLGSRWVDVARARTDAQGRFLARWWPNVLGRVRLRLHVAGGRGPGATVVEPVATVFHRVVASWYGPGGTTACGETLGVGTLGVANRTLPCGTMVTLRYGARTVRVPVIDRGPYVAGRDYDLTYATKLALGAGDISVIWASA
jgi:hypothetical protein